MARLTDRPPKRDNRVTKLTHCVKFYHSERGANRKNPSGTSSGALGRRDFVRPEFIAMLYDAGGPRWSYESRAGLLTFVWKEEEEHGARIDAIISPLIDTYLVPEAP